jgi:hypothetical protein
MRALRESDERIKRDLAADVAKRDQQILGLTDELGKAKPYRRWCVAGGIIAALYVVATLVLKFWKPF